MIGTRFQDQKYFEKFYPIRTAQLKRLQDEAGIYQFHFVLDRAFDYTDAGSLADKGVSVETNTNYLAFLEPKDKNLPSLCSDENESNNWGAFSKIISDERILPIAPQARNALWLHFPKPNTENSNLRRGIQTVSNSMLWWRRRSAERSFYLYAGEKSRLTYAHKVPSLDSVNTTLGEIDIQVEVDTNKLDVGTVGSRAIGNYGVQEITISALKPTYIGRKITYKFSDTELHSQNGKNIISTNAFEIPIFVRWSLLNWVKTSLLPFFILFISLFVLGLSGFLEKNMEKIISGTLSFDVLLQNWQFVIVIILASAAATLAIPFFKDKEK